ncbi:hypothetical protein BV25DRAFT_1824202 [Artomyces pyxidatus]|uniref:Uncharacterized protein n=1 Tax=Artomyces pyxidatus TaxID=48021 RepID=A0ACB8T680_9AGAM|nr:hypothetical protein BV25DRAFT_1824202 [Artomyces pyxidatus]
MHKISGYLLATALGPHFVTQNFFIILGYPRKHLNSPSSGRCRGAPGPSARYAATESSPTPDHVFIPATTRRLQMHSYRLTPTQTPASLTSDHVYITASVHAPLLPLIRYPETAHSRSVPANS